MKKSLIVIFAIAFSVYCANGHGQENRLPLLFAPAFGKALINIPKPFIEVSYYCFSPDFGVEARTYRRVASDEGFVSEDSSTSDESGDNSSDENEDEDENDVQCLNTTVDPFRALNEFSQFCTALRLKMIEQDSISDREIPTEPMVKANSAERAKVYQCNHEDCNYSTDKTNNLNRHKLTHLPANQRHKQHQCNHEGCNYSTDHTGNLKVHKRKHLPVDQRHMKLKIHQCNHEGCNYITDQMNNLNRHQLTHLPADQRHKRHQCDHQGCNFKTEQKSDLKRHKQTHLPADQRTKRLKRKAHDQLPPDKKKRRVIKDETSDLSPDFD